MMNIAHPDGGGRQQPDPAGYTILSAAFGDADDASAVIVTEEAGPVAVSPGDTPALWAALLAWRGAGGAITAYAAPVRNQVLARDIVAGWTAEDLVLIEALAKDSAPARLFLKQLEVRGEKPIDLDSASFRDAWALMTQALGASRTAAMMTALRAIAR